MMTVPPGLTSFRGQPGSCAQVDVPAIRMIAKKLNQIFAYRITNSLFAKDVARVADVLDGLLPDVLRRHELNISEPLIGIQAFARRLFPQAHDPGGAGVIRREDH